MTILVGTPFARNAGYFKNDDSQSGGAVVEDDIQTCKHCQAVIKMRVWKEIQGGYCSKCNSPLCNNPECIQRTAMLGCVPFLKQLEQQVAEGEKFAKFLKEGGFLPSVPPRPLITDV